MISKLEIKRDAEQYINRLSDGLPHLIEKLRLSTTKNSLYVSTALIELAEGLIWLEKATTFLEIEEFNKVNQTIIEINHLIKSNDFYSIGDNLEYELIPQLNEMLEMIKQVEGDGK